MEATGDLLEIVVRAAADDARGAKQLATRLLTMPGISPAFEARAVALLAFTEYLDADYADAVVTAERAVALARLDGGVEPMLYALGMRLLASAGTPWAGTDVDVDHFALAWTFRERLDELEPNSRMIAGHLLVEGLLSTGRMAEGEEVLGLLGDVRASRSAEDEARHPYLPFMQLQTARILYFQGRISEARPIAEAVVADAERIGDELWTALAQGYLAALAGNLGDTEATLRYVEAMIAPFPEPRGYLGAAVYAIAGYALASIGRTDRAVEFALLGGGDRDLSRLQVGDRALTFDLLVTAALASGDLAAAEDWGSRSMALVAHPAATAIVEQTIARLDLARGDAVSSAERATVSAARARLTGRYLDAARSDLLRARALAAAGLSGPAIRELRAFSRRARDQGLYVLGDEADDELRVLGQPSHHGWTDLSERERQVAVLAAEGFSNRVIGKSLFLSERTVQSHISRVLAAFGIGSRSALPSLVAAERLGRPQEDLAALTPRQWAVAELVADGTPNRVIALQLSISVKTVEKHVGEILGRWGLSSRTAIARVVIAERARSGG